MFGERGGRHSLLSPLSINVLLFAITQVARLGQREEKKKKKKKKKRREGSEERQGNSALGGTEAPAFLSQSDLFRLVAASMRGHSNLAIFARANLKKHERALRCY